jgi:hypothetical protein
MGKNSIYEVMGSIMHGNTVDREVGMGKQQKSR